MRSSRSRGGIAQAFVIGREFVDKDNVALILGDNIFFGASLRKLLQNAHNRVSGATIFAYHVEDPQRYGVVTLDDVGRPIGIVEKPAQPESPWAVTGLYFYDNRVLDIAASVKRSRRGELEITDVNRVYLELGELHVNQMSRGFAWLDTGTHESLLEASEFVRTIQHRQGMQIACLEEVAFINGYISRDRLIERGRLLAKTAYGQYLLRLADENLRAIGIQG